MSGFRARPEAKAIAAKFPPPEESRVMNVLAAAGPSLPGAVAVLCAAIARLLVERAPACLHEAMLGAAAHAIVQQLLMRRQRPGART